MSRRARKGLKIDDRAVSTPVYTPELLDAYRAAQAKKTGAPRPKAARTTPPAADAPRRSTV